MSIVHLSDIRLSESDLPDARLSSSQRLYSPTAPSPPKAEIGWRDRWWIEGEPSRCVAIHYWIFDDPSSAYQAAAEGRRRLSARQILVDGQLHSIYQPIDPPACGEACWQALHNILFVRASVTVLVAESGQKVSLGETLRIADLVDARIVQCEPSQVVPCQER